MKLVIVESPTKCETIKKYLGHDFDVMASYGHIRDLSTSGKGGLGVDIENEFKPTYIINKDKKKTVATLLKAAKSASEVILATDPDREGEAISWHLAEVLNLDVNSTKRLEFHEVTKKAVTNALDNPRTIDLSLVQSQETRRIIDRIMGFKLSTLLKRKIGSLSAGRVQSVTLKLITDREKEIKAFVPQEYWTIKGIFDQNVEAKLDSFMDEDITIHNQEAADRIEASLPEQFIVNDVNFRERKIESKPPFKTSTLQQEAYNRFKYSTKRTSMIAQRLFEGINVGEETIGLITYMRTDSVRLSQDFVSDAYQFIENQYGKEYKGFVKAGKDQGQDAHEAIRPTTLKYTPDSIKEHLSKDQYNLYKLIFNRTIASLMSARIENVTTVKFDGNGYIFKCEGSVLKFDGFSKIMDNAQTDKIIKDFKVGQKVQKEEIIKEQHFTKPLPRFTEARLVKMMEELEIGRPSTYASTISTLYDRGYVTQDQGQLIPSEQGFLTVEALSEYFEDFVDTSFTAKMEKDLDDIHSGNDSRNHLLNEFYQKFEPLYEEAVEKMPKGTPQYTGNFCPKCGKPLVLRKGKFGTFEACSGYPDCKYIVKEEKEIEYAGKDCPRCGKPLVKRHSKKGEFIGCSGYPQCTYIEGEGVKEEPIISDKICPECGAPMILHHGKRGKSDFYGCSKFPKCRHLEKAE